MPLHLSGIFVQPEGLFRSHGILRQDRIRQFHVRRLQARVVGADFLHGGFQVRAADAAVAGDEAAGIVLGGDDQFVILERQLSRTGGGTGGKDITPKAIGHRRTDRQGQQGNGSDSKFETHKSDSTGLTPVFDSDSPNRVPWRPIYFCSLCGVTRSTSSIVVKPAATFCAPDNRRLRMPTS